MVRWSLEERASSNFFGPMTFEISSTGSLVSAGDGASASSASTVSLGASFVGVSSSIIDGSASPSESSLAFTGALAPSAVVESSMSVCTTRLGRLEAAGGATSSAGSGGVTGSISGSLKTSESSPVASASSFGCSGAGGTSSDASSDFITAFLNLR